MSDRVVVLVAPDAGDRLAALLRTIVERVARGVRLVERPAESIARARDLAGAIVVGLEVPATGRIALGLAARGGEGGESPVWLVPREAFGRTIDDVERVQRLGSLLAACLDLMAAGAMLPKGTRWVLAGSAHLSAEALREELARATARRAAATMQATLAEGAGFTLEPWELPAELAAPSVVAALARGDEPEIVRGRAMIAAERVSVEVAAAIDQALAAHGLAAVEPLVAALDALDARLVAPPDVVVIDRTPSPALVEAAEARLAKVPRALPGAGLLTLAWAIPVGLVGGVVGSALIPERGHMLAAAGGTLLFLGAAGLARVASRIRRVLVTAERDRHRADCEEATARREQARRAALAPDLVRGALAWLSTAIGRERGRLVAIAEQVKRLEVARPTSPAPASATTIDIAVDLAPARELLDGSPERIAQRIRAELANDWRAELPTLCDVLGAARAAVGSAPPWRVRSDVARALEAPVADALAILDRSLCGLVPRGLPVERVAVVPPPFEARTLALDGTWRSAGDAHLIVHWGTSLETAARTGTSDGTS